MKEVYILLRERLKEITELKEVDWYTGQDAQTGEQAMLVDAAAYIEFQPIEWQSLLGGIQQAVVSFDVHFVQDRVLDGDGPIINADILHLDIVRSIYTKLQGFSALLSDLPGLSALAGTKQDAVVVNDIVRELLSNDHSLSNLMVTTQRFRCMIRDYAAAPIYQIIANLNLDLTVTI